MSGIEPSFDPRRYWQARFEKGYSLASVGWLGLGLQYNKWMYRVRRALFLSRMKPLLKTPNFDVLDIGSGTGFYIELWQELGAQSITGLDITDLAVRELAQKFPTHKFIRADIGDSSIELPSQMFGVISAMDMLYHIVDDDRYSHALMNIARLLKTGGIFVFTENFLHHEGERARHQVSRSLQSIEFLLEGLNLKPIMRRPVFVLMNAPVDSDNRLYHKFWNLLFKTVTRHEIVGFAIGASLYPLELLLAAALKEGPSTEMMLCLKKS